MTMTAPIICKDQSINKDTMKESIMDRIRIIATGSQDRRMYM